MIARDQDCPEAGFAEGNDGVDGVGLQRVAQGDEPEHAAVAGHRDHRTPLFLQADHSIGTGFQIDASLARLPSARPSQSMTTP